mmetsp:Transcript_43819/g.107588  ORF Transcript_43819/g.107588 Transcript_43819/m.107588 type:complete len:238 (+) Transcript_43819:1-714(+)
MVPLLRSGRVKAKHLLQIPPAERILDVVRPGATLTLRKILENISFTLSTATAARLGAEALASMEVGRQYWIMSGVLWWPLSIAALSLCSKAFAMGDNVTLTEITDRILRLGGVFGVLAGLFAALTCRTTPRLFSQDATVLRLSSTILPIAGAIMPLAAMVDVLENTLIAVQEYMHMTVTSAIGVACVFIALQIFVGIWGFGVAGVWLSFACFMGVRFLGALWKFKSIKKTVTRVAPA